MLDIILNNWQINLIFSIILAVSYNQLYKLSTKTIKNDGAGAIALQTLAGLSILILAPLFPIIWPEKIITYLLLV